MWKAGYAPAVDRLLRNYFRGFATANALTRLDDIFRFVHRRQLLDSKKPFAHTPERRVGKTAMTRGLKPGARVVRVWGARGAGTGLIPARAGNVR